MTTTSHLTDAKRRLLIAVRSASRPQRTAPIAAAADVSLDYAARMLTELHDEGLVDRARDSSYHGRGQAPYLWSCCGF